MPILDDDETVIKTVMEHVNEEVIRLFVENQLPSNIVDNLIKEIIEEIMKKRSVNQRDASYDFCYLYFQRNKGKLGGQNMACSCMHLWSYLASWGMLRNSPLLQLSPAALKPLIAYFDRNAKSVVWNADVDSYCMYKTDILNAYNDIFKVLTTIFGGKKPRITLVTKIMLGVFGCVPAIDAYFYKTFHLLYGGFGRFTLKELDAIEDFYKKHQTIIDKMFIPVIDFGGNPQKHCYKKAKLIDMFGFAVGQHIKP